MRLVAGVLALTLFASAARADDTRPAGPTRPTADATHGKVPLRVVRVMPESRQALLFDRTRATHVLAEVGGKIDGYTVDSIDDDEVTLTFDGTQIVLAAPAHGNRRRDRDGAAVHGRSAGDARQPDTAGGDPAPVDPYGDPPVRVVEAPGAAAPGERPERTIEPGDGGVRVVEAPGSTTAAHGGSGDAPGPEAHPVEIPPSGPSGIRTVEAPSGANAAAAPNSPAPATSAPSASVSASSGAPAAAARTPAPRARTAQDKQTLDARALADIMTADGRGHTARIPPPAALDHALPAPAAGPAISGPRVSDGRSAAAPPGAPGAIVLSHGDLDGALADFAALASAIHGSFSTAGLAVDQVAGGTIFQRAGLRTGDLVTAVDGVRLRSLDDAAALYARAPTASAITAQIVRDGKPMTLHVVIR